MDPDLSALAAHEARPLASALNKLLQSVHFDVVNRELRLPRYGGDYDLRPFPLPGSPIDVAAMRVRLRQGVKTSPGPDERKLARRIQYAFAFFMFGDALQRQPIEELFGEQKERIDEGLRLGLFVNVSGQAVRMNGLSLFSVRLRNGEVIHLFADTPPHFEHRLAAPRVYIGADSYELLNRISATSGITGCCVEIGSGSGIQLVSALKHHPGITKAIGTERDRRAVNVSLFNAALNGVADRMTIVADDETFRSELDGQAVSLAMTNPPFLAVPTSIDVDGVRANLRTLFPEAGWGGEDGLEVTEQFINLLEPVLGPGVPLIVYSQFAGDVDGPTRLRACSERAGFELNFEPLPSRPVFARQPETNRILEGRTEPVLSREQAAYSVARLIVAALLSRREPQRFRSVVKKGSAEHRVLLKLCETLEESYRRQAISHFHDGFAVLTKPASSRL